MRRLSTWVFLVVMLSQFPQISDQFKEEQEGIRAACDKANKTAEAAKTAYSKTQSNVLKVQSSLSKLKSDVDKGVAYTNKASSEVSKYCESVKSLANGLGESTTEPAEKQGGADKGTGLKARK